MEAFESVGAIEWRSIALCCRDRTLQLRLTSNDLGRLVVARFLRDKSFSNPTRTARVSFQLTSISSRRNIETFDRVSHILRSFSFIPLRNAHRGRVVCFRNQITSFPVLDEIFESCEPFEVVTCGP